MKCKIVFRAPDDKKVKHVEFVFLGSVVTISADDVIRSIWLSSIAFGWLREAILKIKQRSEDMRGTQWLILKTDFNSWIV